MQLPQELINETWLFADAYSEREWQQAETIVAANLAERPPDVRERVRCALRELVPISPSDWDKSVLEPIIERTNVFWDAPEDRARLRQAFASVLDSLDAVGD